MLQVAHALGYSASVGKNPCPVLVVMILSFENNFVFII
jgi:hypothetical protein